MVFAGDFKTTTQKRTLSGIIRNLPGIGYKGVYLPIWHMLQDVGVFMSTRLKMYMYRHLPRTILIYHT